MPGVNEPIVVAAFDFDGTLTRGGSVWPFLVAVAGRRTVWSAVLRLAPQLAAGALAGGRHADRAKERLFVAVLGGRPAVDVERAAAAFGRHHFQRRARPDMVERFHAHRRAGHRLAIVSASPELYLRSVAEQLGAEALVATRLAVDSDGRLTGRFEGPNCRGPHKRLRLQQWAAELAAAARTAASEPPAAGQPTRPVDWSTISRRRATTRAAVACEGPLVCEAPGGPPVSEDRAGPSEARKGPMACEGPEVPFIVWAYGNSAGDLDMLRGADVPVSVGRLGRAGRLHQFPTLRRAPDPLAWNDSPPQRHGA